MLSDNQTLFEILKPFKLSSLSPEYAILITSAPKAQQKFHKILFVETKILFLLSLATISSPVQIIKSSLFLHLILLISSIELKPNLIVIIEFFFK